MTFPRLLLLACLLAGMVPASAQKAIQAPPRATLPATPLPEPPHTTLDRVRNTKTLVCGVAKEEEDYSRSEDHGNRAKFDIDLCTAVGVAVLGPGARLVIKSFPDEPFALRALGAGEIDVMATASLSMANAARNVALSSPILFDGQSLLLPNNAAVHSPADMAGKRICFLTGSAAEEGLHRYAELHGISFTWYPFSEAGEMEAAFFTGNCDAVTSDLTQLANIRAIEPGRAHEFSILPETFRQDPLGVATWSGDARFTAMVQWVTEALLDAEALGITRANAEAQQSSGSPEVQELLGQRFGAAAALGLPEHWAAHVVEAVGNYGELYARDLGADSPFKLERGQNRLRQDGGALYPVPVRAQ